MSPAALQARRRAVPETAPTPPAAVSAIPQGLKTWELVRGDGSHYAWMVRCPACSEPHQFDSRWEFNGDHVAPSFTPSLRVSGRLPNGDVGMLCHSFLTDGVWLYYGDSAHAMKGLSVPAPVWES